MRAVTSVSVSTRGHAHMRGSEPQDGLFGGSAAAGLKVERGPGGGCSQNGCGFAPHAAVTGLGDHQRTFVAFVLAQRSEEHTSELQSPCNLVYRLLLLYKTPP